MWVNEVFGWCWVLAGILVGLGLGLRFERDDWLGGYASLRRRLLRLGHISFVALGLLNVLFAFAAVHLRLGPTLLPLASGALILGAISMPACCGLMAWKRAFQPLFGVPVLSLLLGVGLVAAGALRA